MKKTLISCLLSVASFSTLAASNSVDLKVNGVLVNGACTPTLDGGGTVNYGHIPVGNLSPTATNQLGIKPVNLTITCDQAIPIGFTTTDNRASSLQVLTIANAYSNGISAAAATTEYGLGTTAGGVKIGAYAIGVTVGGTTADGVVTDLLSNGNGADTSRRTWSKTSAGSTLSGSPGFIRVLTSAATGTLTPISAKVFVYPLRVVAAIQSTNALAITDNTNLDGDTTISLVYL